MDIPGDINAYSITLSMPGGKFSVTPGDYFATGDRAYLERMWSHVVKAMDSIEQLDSDSDALPGKNASQNTYDAWHFCGTSTYIPVLWLASLKAASAMAEITGDSE